LVKLGNCRTLTLGRLPASTWYRALPPNFWEEPLATAHTSTLESRFSAAHPRKLGHDILYLTESATASLFEINAMLGPPHGVYVPSPGAFFSVLAVQVELGSVVDLTSGPELRRIGTSIQELTGDWLGYKHRDRTLAQDDPFPPDVPTHRLGAALYRVRDLEGFLTYSAKVPDQRNLVIFPEKLKPTSSILCREPAGRIIQRLP